jgi:integrase
MEMKVFEKDNVIYGAFGKRQNVQGSTKGTERPKLGDLLEDWNTNINYVRNSKTTWVFTANLQRHILSFWGKDFPLCDMTTKEILTYFTFLKSSKSLSSNTINKHRTHLMTLFEYMVENSEIYGIEVNPVRKIRPLKQEPFFHHIYQPEEAREILSALKSSEKIGLEVAAGIALYCGCRREEVCALRWDNVDMVNRVLTICEVRTTAGKEIVKMNHTKNHTVRQIGIPDALYDILKRAEQQQKKDRKNYGYLYKNKPDFVLREKDGAPWHPNNVTKRWTRFIHANGFRYIRYHDLRHTNLSLLMTKMSAVDVAKLGGHTKVSTTTNIYGHSFNNAVETGVKTINELL